MTWARVESYPWAVLPLGPLVMAMGAVTIAFPGCGGHRGIDALYIGALMMPAGMVLLLTSVWRLEARADELDCKGRGAGDDAS